MQKPTTIKNPQSNAILERLHDVMMSMLCTAELDMADTVTSEDLANFLSDASWAIRSTHHTVPKASPGAAVFGRDMLFDIPYLLQTGTKLGNFGKHKPTAILPARTVVGTTMTM